jgi:MSHA biogenesis protein MshK
MAGRLRAPHLAALAVLLVAAVQAQQGMQDPTRPPANWVGGSATAEGAGTGGLQSVILPRRGKPSAIINGQRVELGGKYGDQRVVKISESEVVLKGSAGLETLKMVPDVEKRMKPVARKKKAAQEDKP